MMVSIAIISFNQEAYIHKAFEGILAQRVNFDIEIVISDDQSTDSTWEIIERLAGKHQDKIRVVSPDTNLGMTHNFNHVLGKCKGKYIAICDGDDYWTDTDKLQKQVNFLEQNVSYSFCCHGYSFHYSDGSLDDESFRKLATRWPKGFDITTQNILQKWVTQPLTVVFRKENVKLPLEGYHQVFDIVLFCELLFTGNARWLPFNGGSYRIHDRNYWNTLNHLQKFKKEYNTFKEIYRNHDQERVYAKAVLRTNYHIIKCLSREGFFSAFPEILKYSFQMIKNAALSMPTFFGLRKS